MQNNTIDVLFLGDIVGPLGRKAVKTYLSSHEFDFVIANGENTTHGKGLSYDHYLELLSYGVNALTSGNHYFNVKDIFKEGVDYKCQVRPANLDPKAPGVGSRVFQTKDGVSIRVTNLLGRVFLSMTQSNPFYAFDRIYEEAKEAIHIVDFHAEATAEKRIFAEYVKGRASAVIGTHTHVQTADSRILKDGTFFLTDAGMNGAYESSLGDNIESAMEATITGIPSRFEVVREGPYMVNGVVMTIDVLSGKVIHHRMVYEVYKDGQ